MKRKSPLPALAVSVFVAAALASVMVEEAWFLWLPVLLALAVAARVWCLLTR